MRMKGSDHFVYSRSLFCCWNLIAMYYGLSLILLDSQGEILSTQKAAVSF